MALYQWLCADGQADPQHERLGMWKGWRVATVSVNASVLDEQMDGELASRAGRLIWGAQEVPQPALWSGRKRQTYPALIKYITYITKLLIIIHVMAYKQQKIQRVQPSSLTRRQVTEGVIPHATSHMMNIGHFKWKKVNFIELFIFEFKHCSSIQHIQQENIIENQHKMSNM